MSIINTALIGKLKKTKADKTNVLQKDNTGVYTPTSNYHPSTKKYVDDSKLKSIVDTSVYSLYDDHASATANDLSTLIGPVSSFYTKNYDKSLFLQDQSLVLNPNNIQLPVTIEGWVFYNDSVPSLSTIFEIGGDIAGGGKQSISVHSDGSAYYTSTTGANGITSTPSTPFTPQAAWVHYALYVSETSYAVWVNGTRKLSGTLGVWVNGSNYAQTVARTYFAYGTATTTHPSVAPNCFYDSVRISNGDIYGASNTSITVPSIFVNDGLTRHLFHIASVQNTQVVNAMFINPPTALNNPTTKQYVDEKIAAIPQVTDTFTSGGYVSGQSLILNQNTGATVNIDVSALLDDTTNTITSGILTGSSIRFTRQDGSTFDIDVTNLYDDTNLVTSVNGNTGAVEVPLLSSVAFHAQTNTLSVFRSDLVEYTADLSSLAQNYYVDSATLNGKLLTLGRTGGIGDVTVDLAPIIPVYNQSLNTTNDVQFASVIANYLDTSTLNVNSAITLGTVNGAVNQVIVTKPGGESGWASLKTVNGETLVGVGDIVIDVPTSTDEITEGFSNLYFTNERARNSISVAGPQTQLSYDNLAGVFRFTPTDISGKQDVLVSGTSIKTINGQSLLGSGNIEITANGIDKYVVSGTVSGSTLTLTNNDSSTIAINVGALLDDTTNTVSSGVLTGNIIRFTRQDGSTFDVNVSSLYDDTNLVTSVNGQTGAITISDTNDYVDSATLNGNVLTLGRTGSLSDLTVDLSSLKTTDTDNYVDSAALNGNVLTLGRSGSLSDLTVDLSSLRTIDTDNYVDSAVLNGNVLTLGRSGSLPDLSIDLSSLNTGGGTSNINVFSRREKQDFTAQANQTQFVTSLDLIDVEVFYNGFKLDEEDYTISGSTVTLLEAAQTGDNIEIIDYGSHDLTGETFITSATQPSNPSVGTVWQDISGVPTIKIWNGTIWVIVGAVDAAYDKYKFNVTATTSSFSAVYTVGFVEVFFNGLKLTDDEYVATNGASVVLTSPAENGDYIEIISLRALTAGEYYSKDQVDVLLSNIDLSNYYTKAEVDQMIAGAGTGSTDTSGLTSQVIDTFSTNDYRSGEYLLLVSGTSGFMTLKMIVLFNGTTALNSQYGQLGDDLGSFDTLVSGSNVQVVFTPVDASAKVQFSRTMIAMPGTTPTPTTLPTDLNSGSGTVDLNSGSGTIDLNGTSVGGDLMSGSGTIDLMSGSGISDMNV